MDSKNVYRGYSINSHGKRFKFWNGTKQITISTLEAAKQAIDELVLRKAQAEHQKELPVITVEEALKKYADWAVLKQMDKTSKKNIRVVWRHITQTWFHDVTREVVLETLNKNPDWGQSTKKQMLSAIRSVVRFVKDLGCMVDDSVLKIPVPTIYENVEEKTEASEEDTERVLDYAKKFQPWQTYQLTAFICMTGCRPATVENLLKTDYDKAKKLVKVIGNNSKSRAPIYIPVTPELEVILDKAVAQNPNEYLFNNTRNKKWAMDSIATVMKRYKALGIVKSNISWYSWRIKKDNDLIKMGLNPYDHSKITGHNVATIAKHYHKVDMGNILKAMSNKVSFKYFDGTNEYTFSNLDDLIKHVRPDQS